MDIVEIDGSIYKIGRFNKVKYWNDGDWYPSSKTVGEFEYAVKITIERAVKAIVRNLKKRIADNDTASNVDKDTE